MPRKTLYIEGYVVSSNRADTAEEFFRNEPNTKCARLRNGALLITRNHRSSASLAAARDLQMTLRKYEISFIDISTI